MLTRGGARHLRRWRQRLAAVPRHPGLEAALLICVVLGVSAAVLVQARRTALDDASTSATNLAALLEEQTQTAINSADLALMSMVTWLEREALSQDDPDFRAYLRAADAHLDYVRALFVIGPDGYITHDTDYPDTPRTSLADRRYFEMLRDHRDAELFIGRPVLSRSLFRWFVPVARRFEFADGRFAGVVVAAVEPSFVERSYSRLQLREHDAISLFHADSTLIARVPAMPDLYGQKMSGFDLFTTRLPRSPRGVYETRNKLSGRYSIVGYEKLEGIPLVVAVVIDQQGALTGWRHFVVVVLLADVLIITLVALLYSQQARRQLERQVARQKALMQEKVETIGYMTSGVAHDFRNLLAAIRAGVRMLRNRGADDTLLLAMDEATDRGLALTSDLLQFAKDHEIKKRLIDPDQQIERLSGLLRQTTGPGVELQLDLDAGGACVEVSPALLDATLVNLAVNASQAMPDGGDLSIFTRTIAVGDHASLPEGDYVAIRVHDTGHGIAPEALEKLFQPFVTTKGSSGTGIGLFQARRFVEDCGGDIRVASYLGKGTHVEILLPSVVPERRSEGAAADANA